MAPNICPSRINARAFFMAPATAADFASSFNGPTLTVTGSSGISVSGTISFAGRRITRPYSIKLALATAVAAASASDARRLTTVMEKLLEELSFSAPERRGEKVTVDAAMVEERLAGVVEDADVARFIL